MSAQVLALVRAGEEELREAQKHAARVRSVWPPSSQLQQAQALVQRCSDLVAAAQRRLDRGGATEDELRNGWEALARLQLARTRARERFRQGVR